MPKVSRRGLSRLDPMRITGRIGFYGCTSGGGRLVRVGLSDESNRPPRFATVDCPACGNEHKVELTWRQPSSEADEDREPELILDAAN